MFSALAIITDLVDEIQSRFMVAVRPGAGKSMTFGSLRVESVPHQSSFPCAKCDFKCSSLEELNSHAKNHVLDESVHSATQRLHSLTGGGLGDNESWPLQPPKAQPSLQQNPPPEQSVTLTTPELSGRRDIPEPDGGVGSSLHCPICNKTFNKIVNLNHHMLRHQQTGVSPKQTYSCKHCGKVFNHMSNRNKHERVHCEAGATARNQARLKTMTDIGSQYFTCRKCHKPYGDNANRLRHERMCRSGSNALSLATSAIPSPAVEQSSKPSGNSLELPISVNNYKHMASTAAHTKILDENGRHVNMYSCVICAKLVQTRSSLESHYMSHLGIKPHACKWCSKRFTDASNWRKHERGCTERPVDDVNNPNNFPTMVPPASGPVAYYPRAEDGMFIDYPGSHSTIDSSSITEPNSQEPPIKQEAVDISSDTESTALLQPPATPNDANSVMGDKSFTSSVPSPDNGGLTIASPSAVPGNLEISVDAELEDPEQRDINTADSVVVDSALSWFVEDKELTSLRQDEEDTMS